MTLALAFGLSFAELYSQPGLARLDDAFCRWLAERDTELFNRLVTARAAPDALASKDESALLIALGPLVEEFTGQLFGIEGELAALHGQLNELAPLYSCKRLFVQRRAAKALKPEEAQAVDGEALVAQLELGLEPETLGAFELAFARNVMHWLGAPEMHAPQLDAATRYAAWALLAEVGRAKHRAGLLFKAPRKLDFAQLVPVETEQRDGVTMLKIPHHHERARNGFSLTDTGGSVAQSLDEANYCIWCHNQGKDSCAKGLREKDGAFKQSPLAVPLNGCPLEEKISEMHVLRSEGSSIGALAMITVDNPMCAGTGHRICNDCMKSCIYQKQEPVNIPQSETRALRDVLALPFGFEIYSLLTRWNPLNIRRPLPRPATGKRVLVAGLGPAGYTLAHHVMNDGHTVVGIDGLKIEPLPPALGGVDAQGGRVPFAPVRDIAELTQDLATRSAGGFGGVAEYGITVRWDKNFLLLLRLLLERRAECALIGGVRFGGTLTVESAWELGFDHIALCMGAGKPTVIDMPGALARGVRTASDFLMALQLTGAGRADSIANLQLRLPAVVIGGGLTAIDTATEALAYYPVQVEKFLTRYEALLRAKGEKAVRAGWSEEETETAEEFIAHAKALREERSKPAPDIIGLLRGWGGVTMAYRKTLADAPSYRLNHEEVEKALEEGIFIAEGLEPQAIETDEWGHVKGLVASYKSQVASSDPATCNLQPATVKLPARAVLMAAGTAPNTTLAREDAQHVKLHGKYFQAVDETGAPASPERSAKPATVQVLMALEADGRAVSFFGDLHPSFAGNVVKAMGSAKQGYPVVSRILSRRPARASQGEAAFLAYMQEQLGAVVHRVERLTPTIIEVTLRAPLAARMFRPGQFYRLQNFESNALATCNLQPATILAMEGLALTGATVDVENGLLSTIVLEMGGSSDLCAMLEPGERVVLMGPTGEPTEIPHGETVLLAGGGLGNAVLFSIGQACRAQGNRVFYFAGYKHEADRYKIEAIEQAADVVVWCCDSGSFTPRRAQDRSFHGNIVLAMLAYAEGRLGEQAIPMHDVDRIVAIGSDRMMEAVGKARHSVLKPHLKREHVAIGSINSPMQCMMKEICAQCIQQHVDPATGTVSYVYSCFNQDQELDRVSFPFLKERLAQNGVQEKLTRHWIDACLHSLGKRSRAA